MSLTIVYTDGACLGNPGPGGWAYAVSDGPWRNGAENPSDLTDAALAADLAADAGELLLKVRDERRGLVGGVPQKKTPRRCISRA